jgi:predicted ATP-grasp superfamily ATP-dependent carboligase
VVQVPSPEAIEDAYRRVEFCGPLLLQEIVPGGDHELYSLGSYVDSRSRPLAVFTGRKLRQKPRSFGEARLAESIWVPEVAEAGLRLLGELRFHGVSQVEFKRDPRDGSFRLMEINARHWLWHSLSGVCGVELAYTAYSDCLGASVAEMPKHRDYEAEASRQREGPRWVDGLRDATSSLKEMSRGQLSGREWLRSLRGIRSEAVFSLSDPLPGLFEVKSAGLRHVAGWTRDRQRREDSETAGA